jgi:hypothetical protein
MRDADLLQKMKCYPTLTLTWMFSVCSDIFSLLHALLFTYIGLKN